MSITALIDSIWTSISGNYSKTTWPSQSFMRGWNPVDTYAGTNPPTFKEKAETLVDSGAVMHIIERQEDNPAILQVNRPTLPPPPRWGVGVGQKTDNQKTDNQKTDNKEVAMYTDNPQTKEEKARRHSAGLKLFGGTYPIRKELSQMGGIFDSDNGVKVWLMPDEESCIRVGAQKRNSKTHGIYWWVPKGSGENGKAAEPRYKAGDQCPACRGDEPLETDEDSGVVMCYECGYRVT